MQRLVLLTIAASTLFLSALQAQFTDFAVTDDGRLFFASSLNTGTGDTRYKIYSFTGDGLSLFATGGGDDPFGPIVLQPLTSGDGSITGYMLNYPCRTGSCGLAGGPRSTFQLQGVELSGPAFNFNLQISRNGRFLAGFSAFDGTRIVELPAQRTRQLPQMAFACNTQCIADTGALLLIDSRATDTLFFLPLDGEPIPVPGTITAVSGILSPDGSRIAYERQNGRFFELVLTDPQGSSHRVLATAPVRDVFRPSFANDGTLLFLQPTIEGQMVPMLVSPGDSRVLIPLDSSVTQAILSGNGQLAWLATSKGQLLRVRTADNVADEMIAGTPILQTNSLFALPGSVVRVYGSSFGTDSRFLLGGTALPVSEINANSIALQIPWEYDTTAGSRTLTISGARSPFRQELTFTPLREPTITFERSSNAPLAQIAHQDFRGVVSKDDPALPGETVHVFAANMGPVDQPVATGERSPTSSPARVTTPLACYLIELNSQSLPVWSRGIAVPFAGLAGGSIGIYQIDVTIPQDWAAANPVLQCSVAASSQNRFLGDSARIDVAVPGTTSRIP